MKINDIVIAGPLQAARREANPEKPSAPFASSGQAATQPCEEAVAENFTDRTLPPGPSAGSGGPAFASRRFRVPCRTSR